MALALQVSTFASVAGAQSGGDARGAAAQALFDQARELMAQGRAAEACPKLEESQRLDPAGGTLLNLADCYEQTGRIASAWSTYLNAAAASRASGHAQREAAAREFAEALAPRVPRLAIVVVPEARRVGLEITRDGAVVGEPQWDVPVATDPGRHEVIARAPGHQPWSHFVELREEGKTVRVDVPALEPLARADAEGTATGADGGEAPSGGLGTQRVLALVAGGLGVVGLGVGTVFGLKSMSDKSAADEFCDGRACTDQRGLELRSDALAAGTLSSVGFAVGLAGLAAGAALWFTVDDGPESVAVGVRPDGVAVRGAW
jgi:hypothetical protein